MKKILLSVFSIVSLMAFSQYQVGHTTITFNDPTRSGGFGSGGGSGRQIQTEIYYPAAVAGDNVPVVAGEHPVIVFGHGFAMAWDAYENIWEHYAVQGYVLAFPRTEGSLFPAPSHGDFGLDLKIVCQKMLALDANSGSIFFQKLNDRAGIMGHSMGGGASILAASGNTAINTVIGLAPAETNPSAISAATGVTAPALIFSGSADGVTPPNVHHIPIYDGLGSSCKTFVSITGGGHCYYANTNFNCDFGETTSSPNISISRGQQQTITYSVLDPWLDYTLKGDCDAYDEFLNLAGGGSGFTAESVCLPNPVPVITQNGTILTSSVSGVAYQWYLNGNLISGSNSVQHNYTAVGVYTVEVTHADGCTTISAPLTINSLSVSVLPNVVPVLSPNPTNGILNISNMNEIELEVKVMDISGQEVRFELHDQTLDLCGNAKGVYFITVNGYNFRILKN